MECFASHLCTHGHYLFAGRDIFAMDKLFVPINEPAHWVLVVAYMQEKRIQYFDSSGGNGKKYELAFLRYLEDMHKRIHQKPLPTAEWTLHTLTKQGQPIQPNGYDCGLFVLLTIYYLCLDYPLVFSEEHITQAVRERALPNPRRLSDTRFYQSFLDECRYHLLHSIVSRRLIFNDDEPALGNDIVALHPVGDMGAGI